MQNQSWLRLGLFCLLFFAAAGIDRSASAADLTIGSDAPALDIEHWVQDGNGQFKPVTKFEKNKVYVVEFWATWCPPCVASMPHLAKLQKEYADKDLQIVSISDESVDTVKKFLGRKFEGEAAGEDKKPETYQELTSAYCLTADPDGSSHTDYMAAAGQNGIPAAFIVGKDAKIEWMGHPMAMDEPLKAVLAGSWDRAKYIKRMESEAKLQELLQEQKFDEALKILDELLAETPDMQLSVIQMQVFLATGKIKAANGVLASLFDRADNGEVADSIAWNVYQMAMQGQLPDKSLVATAAQKGETFLPKIKQKRALASLYDSLAHLNQYLGNNDKAISFETKAIENATGRVKEGMKKYLEDLKNEDSEGDSDK